MPVPDDRGKGWKSDPTTRHQYRWWDGTRWTDDVGDGSERTTDPYDGQTEVEQRDDPRRRAIENILARKLRNKLLVRREIKRLINYLDTDEELVTAASGVYEDGAGLLAVTDRRLLFLDEGIVNKRLEELSYARMSSVQWKSGMLMAEIKVFASGNVAVIKNVMPKERAQEIAAYASRRITEGHKPASAAATTEATAETAAATGKTAASAADPIDQIKRLAELRDLGAITTDEFEAKKAQLLDQV